MTNEEKIISFFLEKLKNSKTNEINIGINDAAQIDLTEQEIIQTIFLLQEDDVLTIKRKSVHNNFNMYWTIALKSKCVHYFENKKTDIKTNRRDWIKTYIPITISVLALLKSFQNEIILMIHGLIQLLTQLLER